jgi:hypothetical protein
VQLDTCNWKQREKTISYSSLLGKKNSSTKIKETIDKQMKKYTSLKEIGQVYIELESQKEALTNHG